jgi:hypothetical protein
MSLGILFSIVSALAALVAAVLAAWQAYLLRFSLQVETLLKLEARFNGKDFEGWRRSAARSLLATPGEDADDVLDFLTP